MEVLSRYELAFHTGPVGKHSPHVAFDLGGPILEQAGVAADKRSGQARALPQVMMLRLGHGRAEAPLKLRLDGRQLAALALEAAVLVEVQLDLEDSDEGHKPLRAHEAEPRACGYESVCSTCFFS